MSKFYRTFAVSVVLLTAAPNIFAEKTISILVPPDNRDWTFSTPMISMDGGKTGSPMSLEKEKCGWFSYTFGEAVSDNVVFYRSNDDSRDDMIGFNGNWETGASTTPIPLATLFETYNADTLYFVTDEQQLFYPDDTGWYTEYPEGAEGVCIFYHSMQTYPASAADIEKLKDCGPECVTDIEKFASIFSSNQNGSCSDEFFVRDTSFMWVFTKGNHSASCSSMRSSFSKNPNQRMRIQNANLAWIFIDGQPVKTSDGGYASALDIDSYKDVDGNSLVDGRSYSLEIFFCDQEGTSENIQVSSNLNIRELGPDQLDISTKVFRDTQNPKTKNYEICIARSTAAICEFEGISSSGNLQGCGKDIEKVLHPREEQCCNTPSLQYHLTQGSNLDLSSALSLKPYEVNNGGIDLTDPYNPKVNADNVVLPPGKWTLYLSIRNGSMGISLKKLQSIAVSGNVNLLTAPIADVLDSNGVPVNGLSYQFQNEGIAGAPIPLYVSAIVSGDNGKKYMIPSDAVGIAYSLVSDNPTVHIYEKTGDNEYHFIDGAIRNIGKNGVDTVYAYMDKVDLSTENNKANITIINNPNEVATIQFKTGSVQQNVVMAIGKSKSGTAAKLNVTQVNHTQFSLTLDNNTLFNNYTIFNTKGRVVQQGFVNNGTALPIPGNGTYIIKVGNTSKIVKFH